MTTSIILMIQAATGAAKGTNLDAQENFFRRLDNALRVPGGGNVKGTGGPGPPVDGCFSVLFESKD
jgi:hypothetical protein